MQSISKFGCTVNSYVFSFLSLQIWKFQQTTEEQITRSLEAYLMWLFGKIMFIESHGDTISAGFIPIALEIANAVTPDDITPRSWGSALLACTYRAMCISCRKSKPGSILLGCPLFLQLWSWERFAIGRPDINVSVPFPNDAWVDPDRIDMPTIGALWTHRKVHVFILFSLCIAQIRTSETNCYFLYTETVCL
jgi:hypothetical protein